MVALTQYQRAFEAASRVFTTADQLLEDLINTRPMRITDNMRFGSVQRSLASLRSRHATLTNQLSSGRKLLAPSDDPVAAAKLTKINARAQRTADYQNTISAVRADIELQGGVKVQRLAIVALPQLGDGPLLGMDVLGRLHWQQRGAVLRFDLDGDAH